MSAAIGGRIVAFGIVVNTVVENHNSCVGVAIDTAIDGVATLPMSTDDALTIADVLGTEVPWPVHLIKLQPEVIRIFHFPFVSYTIMYYYTCLTWLHFHYILQAQNMCPR